MRPVTSLPVLRRPPPPAFLQMLMSEAFGAALCLIQPESDSWHDSVSLRSKETNDLVPR